MKKAVICLVVILIILIAIFTIYKLTTNSKTNTNNNKEISKEENNSMNQVEGHLTVNSTISDVVNHKAFSGFGEYILPLNWNYDENMKLSNVQSLVPYHSNVRGTDAVETINYMIDGVNNNTISFYNIYSEQEKKQDSRKEDTGIFFFKGEPNAPFAVVCPGGGYSYVGSIHEGFPLAIEISKKGYNAFVIQYRVGGEQVACEDLARAISYIFENSNDLQVSINDYSVWGGSAGARMAARIGSNGTKYYGGNDLPRPATVVFGYTGHSNFTENDPATFFMVGENDGIANPSGMERRANAMS